MKLLSTLFFSVMLLISPLGQDELQAVEATYDGQSGGVFYFVDMEGSSYAFNDLEPKAKEKYDLTNTRFEGRKFTVIYRIVYQIEKDKEQQEEEQEAIVDDDEESEEEYDYGECIIVDLEPVG
ncbi:hypothetical protein SAMN05421636_104413 [Pricia antarctica]|uniref:Uncharacterized protein n=1 Tax=Pricia antarctica TaxID=641691 RepID=A0A1G7C5Y9_9FLAO|nr:hypothetical protein [Pricia antarctica]SDE34190.1 hypothetical protein SAMN05421636_104413 [Pricia antarctica]